MSALGLGRVGDVGVGLAVFMKSAQLQFTKESGRNGFALLITITLLAFLVLVLVSLATLTRVETQVAANSQRLSLARQNAILGLNVALGRLQQLGGPDQRVTATSDIVTGHHATKTHWSGVWDVDAAHASYGENIGWLVSGAVPPGDPSLAGPLVATLDNPLVTLVGQNTVGVEDATSVVQVNAEPIKSDAVPGLPGAQTVGHFAYWVGDEGVKAQVSLSDPWVGSADAAERRYSFINMQRSGVELVGASSSTRIGTAYPPNDPRLGRVLFLGQLPLIGPVADGRLPDAARHRFHDLTTVSSSVLVDVAQGGLKKDLTNWIHFGAPAGAVEQDTKPMVIINDPNEDIVGIPQWGLLRSYATMRDAGSALPPQEQTRTQHGLAPVVTYFRFGVNISAVANQPLKMHVFPTVVLWNPHSVPLSHEDTSGNPVIYQLAWRTRVARVWRFVPANDPTPVNSSTKRSNLPMGPAFNIFDIKLTEPIPPGRSLVFTLQPPVGGGDTVPYDPTGGTVLINKAEDGTSAVLEGRTYTDAEMVDGITWNLSSTGGSQMDFVLRRKPSSATLPLGTGQVVGEYQAVEGMGFSGFTAASFDVPKDDLLLAIEPRFSMDMYPHMSGTTYGPSFRWIANQNYRARYIPRADKDGGDPVVFSSKHFGPTSSNAIQPLNFDEGGVRANIGTTVTLATGATARDLVLDEVLPSGAVLTSLAQFQHANLSLVSHYPTYAVGNSLASPYIPLAATEEPIANVPGYPNFHDISYLLNRQLWDRYYLSTIPSAFSVADIADTGYHLPNARLHILRDNGTPALAAVAGEAAFDTAAAHLMVDGGFNVNSTSPQAWRAFLAGHLGVETIGTNRHPFSRFIQPVGATNESWAGYRNLSDGQIDRLAWNIAAEVKRRGPFRSLADFVNRRLVVRGSDPDGTQRYKGALQAAIDICDTEAAPPAGEPPAAPLNFDVEETSTALKTFQRDLVRNKPSEASWMVEQFQGGPIKLAPYSSRSAFAPGYLTQADLLTAIGPALTVRSDTFTIRSYGDVRNPVTEVIESQVWCEAVVQRLPEPMLRKNLDPTHPGYNEPALGTAAAPDFGRRFKIVSFRWLNPGEI